MVVTALDEKKETPDSVERPALNWFPANLDSLNQRFEGIPTQDFIRWGMMTFGEDLAMATGFGPSGIVMMHMMSQVRPQTSVFYLQTDLHFKETMKLRDQLAERLGIRFVEVHSGVSLQEQSDQYGPELWKHSPDLCCQIRKVNPMREYLANKKAWITGIRRDQGPTRANTQLVSWDNANHLIKLAPLAAWKRDEVFAYLSDYDLPYNELHFQGYPSVGCWPCTRKVAEGETDERAGRWAGLDKTECGIHVVDGKVVRSSTIPATSATGA